MNRTLHPDPEEREPADAPIAAQDVTAREFDFVPDKTPVRAHVSTALFGVILVTLVVTYFLFLKTGPQQAAAFSIESPVTFTGSAVQSFLATGPASVKSMEKLLKSTQKVAQRLSSDPAHTQVPINRLKANPFRTDRPATPADAKHEAVVQAVNELQLQSILINDQNRSCTINHGLYLEGQRVDDFTVERISAGSVIVKNGTYRFELTMAKK